MDLVHIWRWFLVKLWWQWHDFFCLVSAAEAADAAFTTYTRRRGDDGDDDGRVFVQHNIKRRFHAYSLYRLDYYPLHVWRETRARIRLRYGASRSPLNSSDLIYRETVECSLHTNLYTYMYFVMRPSSRRLHYELHPVFGRYTKLWVCPSTVLSAWFYPSTTQLSNLGQTKTFHSGTCIAPLHFWPWKVEVHGQRYKNAKIVFFHNSPRVVWFISTTDRNVPIIVVKRRRKNIKNIKTCFISDI